MEVDEVIAIFGLVRVYDGDAPEGVKPQRQYELVRCAFHAYEKVDEADSKEELRAEMLKMRRQQAFQEFGLSLAKKATIDFPHGEKIFVEMRRKPKKSPAKAVQVGPLRDAAPAGAAPKDASPKDAAPKSAETKSVTQNAEKQNAENKKEVNNEKK